MTRVTFPRVVAAEWTKFLSLRSTWIVLTATAVLTVGLAGVISWATYRGGTTGQSVAEAVGRAYLGVDVFSLVLGVFGVVLVTGEYGAGLIRATLAAVPRRWPVLAAKALVLTAVAVPVMFVVCVASFLVAQAFVDAPFRLGLDAPGVPRATLGAVFAPVGLALLGMGFGALLRHTAGAITAYVSVMLVVPALLPAALPASVRDDVVPYVPVAAAQALYAISADAAQNPFQLLSPGHAAWVLLAWVVVTLAAGAAVLLRRDA